MSRLIPSEAIETKIFVIRGHKVMLDSDLAALYEVSTKRLIEQVKRNIERFPVDFMFQLKQDEYEILRSHFATSKQGSGGRRYVPYVFTEQGVAMLSSVLKSKRAIEVNIAIMRAFVKLRSMIASHEELKRKLASMESKYDDQFKVVFEAIKSLMTEDVKPKRKIGFLAPSENAKRRKRS